MTTAMAHRALLTYEDIVLGAGDFMAQARRAFRTGLDESRPSRCMKAAQALSALSDADLARLGIDRADIARRAFRGYVW